MKKLSVLFAAVFIFAGVLNLQAQEVSTPEAKIYPEQKADAVSEKELKAQAKEIKKQADLVFKEAQAKAKLEKQQAKDARKQSELETKTLKDLEAQIKDLEEQVKAIRSTAKAQENAAILDADNTLHSAKAARDAEYKRADALVKNAVKKQSSETP